MNQPIKIAELRELADMHRNSLSLDRDQEDLAFAGLDALLDLAHAVHLSYHADPALQSARDCGDPLCDFAACIAARRLAAFDFTGAR